MLAKFIHAHMRHRSAVNCLLEEETGKLRLKDKKRAFANCLPFHHTYALPFLNHKDQLKTQAHEKLNLNLLGTFPTPQIFVNLKQSLT